MDVHAPAPSAVEADHIARAQALIPLLQDAGPRIDAGRELPADVVDAMHAAGMFRLLVPRSLGGAELLPSVYIQCVEAIAAGDGSTAWCMNQNSGCSMSAAYLDPAPARSVFGGPRDVLAWGQSRGRAGARRVEGGWRVTGTWLFASGSRHATWLGAHCPMTEAGGASQNRDRDGNVVERTLLLPREQAQIDDVWHVVGLRGTGSDTYSVEDLFVPDGYALCRDRPSERRQQGLLYRFSTLNIYAAGFGAVGLGIARGMLDAFVALASKKTPYGSHAMRDSAVVQSLVGLGDAKLRAARTWLIGTLERVQESVAERGHLTIDERLDIRQASTFAIHQAREVVNAVWHEAGATAIFDSGPFERRFRDINTVSQQVQGRAAHFETVGLHMLGGAPDMRWI